MMADCWEGRWPEGPLAAGFDDFAGAEISWTGVLFSQFPVGWSRSAGA